MLCFDPNYKYKFELDKNNFLTFHFPTAAEIFAIEEEFLAADNAEGIIVEVGHLAKAVGILLADWSITDRDGKKVPFDLTRIASIMSPSDLWEIRYRLTRELVNGEISKKNSMRESQAVGVKLNAIPATVAAK